MLYIELLFSIFSAIPTFVEIKGVFVAAASRIDCGPPSTLDAPYKDQECCKVRLKFCN